MSAVVFFERIQHLPCRKLIPQFHFKKTDQNKGQKARGEMCIDMVIRPYVDGPGFKTGFRHLKGVLDPGEAAVSISHLLVTHLQFAGYNGIIPVILFFFLDFFQVKQ